jgi:hypothetical protein
MANVRIPVIKNVPLAIGGTGVADFDGKHGTVHIRLVGTGPVFVKFDAIPGLAAADGQFTLDSQIPFYDVDDIDLIDSVGFRNAGAAICRVEVIAYKSVEGHVLR